MKAKHSTKTRSRQLSLLWGTVITVAVIVLLGMIGTRFYLMMNRRLDMTHSYDIEEMHQVAHISNFTLQKTDAVAEALVSTADDVGMDRITFENMEDERGLLFNMEKKEALVAKDIYDRIYPASITKVMTALLAVKYGNPGQVVTMIDEDFYLGDDAQESDMEPGDSLTMQQLLEFLMAYSANDAANAIARTISGDVDTFVELMNEEARHLGMTGTHFVNPHGLHDDNHYTTVYDIYLMLNEAYKYPAFVQVAALDNITEIVTSRTGESKTLFEYSTDKYMTNNYSLPANVTIMVSKTGTTDEAGSCLALVVQNGYGESFTAILMGAWDKDDLYGDMTKFLQMIND